ncbi:MAG TPA: hypothetical protein VLX60_07700 [Terriglobales bacterium]|nr:hypothetical protein [Terriglobales bacterium]
MRPSLTCSRSLGLLIVLSLSLLAPLIVSAQSEGKKQATPPPKTAPPQTGAKPAPVKPNTPSSATPHTNSTAQPNNRTANVPGKPNPAVTGKPPSSITPGKPPATVSRPDGGKSVTTNAGTLEYNKYGHLDRVVTRSGAEAHFNPGGRVSSIKTPNGMTISHAPGGQRNIITVRHDTNNRVVRVVSAGPRGGGFVEHSYVRGGHEYMRRTYVYGGHTYVNVYRGYPYRGVVYYRYVPAYYYAPGYYGWAYSPWPGPVTYAWGWNAAPWYGPYGYYFAPAPVYPSAAFWLTDYVLAESLRAAYESQQASAVAANTASAQAAPDAESAAGGNVTLSPEVKAMIAEQVRTQLAADRAAAEQGAAPNSAPSQPAADAEQVPQALDPNLRVFIVAANLEVTSDGQSCSLTSGDVLMRSENAPGQDNAVGVNVVSSKKGDCASGTSPRVQVADLQDMHNHFREQMDSGMQTLAQNQGKNGIPTGPTANPRENPDGQAVADLTASADLQKQQQDAEEAEKEVQQASSPGNGD